MNILILTGNFGMGHISAANAIAEKINSEFTNYKVYIEDLFEQLFNSDKYNALFPFVVKQGRCIHKMMYIYGERSDIFKKLPFNRYLLNKVQELIYKYNVDIIISTLGSCSKIVSEYKRLRNSKIPLITCITDVSSHNEWLWPYTDYYLIAAPKIRNELICKGIDKQKIIVSGIPVRGGFQSDSINTERTDSKKLLIMGGGLGLLPKSRNFYEELNEIKNIKTTIITGSNSSLYKNLVLKYENINVLSFVEDVPHYMKDADLLLTKPGGITLYEAITAQIPLLLFPPFLQQEIRNAEFILENKIGEILPYDRGMWLKSICNLLEDRTRIDKIKMNMREFKSYLDESGLLRVLRKYGNQCA